MKRINFSFYLVLLLVNIIFLPAFSFAQSFHFKGHEDGEIRTAEEIKANDHTGTQLNDTIIAAQNNWSYMVDNPTSWGNDLKFKSIHAYVKFKVDHSYYKKIPTAYTFRLVYTLYGYNNPADTNIYSSFNDTLTISYDPDSLATYQDIQVKQYGSFSKIKVVLHGLYEINGSTLSPVNMDVTSNFSRLNFAVEPVIITQPFIKKTKNGSTTSIVYGSGAPSLKMASYSPVNNYMELRWSLQNESLFDPIAAEPAAYELEWTYVDDYDVDPSNGSISYISVSQIKYDFTHNSTRVWLDTNYYRVPIVYPHGYIVYRVRMVRPDSVYFQYPIYSDWSLPESGTVSSATSSMYRKLTTPYMHDSLNWQYTVSFAEDGKYKHVLSFYDGLLKNRQSITRFNSNPDLLIATQNVYDYEGQPSISILPTPIPTQQFVYQPSLALSLPSGLPYKAADFDTLQLSVCPSDITPPALSNTSKANIYYSPLNPDKAGFQKFVPDAGGYPFVETLYSPGYDSRVDKQGGAGDSLQIGKGHTVKNNYVSEDQMDLNRLFGADIGWSGFYRKTVSKDPNGQFSLNVTDYHGKTIASSMIGIPDTTLLAIIPNTNVPDTSTFKEDFIAGTTQQINGNQIILDKSFFNDAGVNTHAKYKCNFTPYPTFCNNQFLSVKVNYAYQVFDECGTIVGHDTGSVSTTGVIPGGQVIKDSAEANFYMNQGQYNIHKDLTINLQDVNIAVDSFMEVANCLKPEREFIKEAVLSKTYPCPDDGSGDYDDPCAQKRLEMMQELWPNIDSVYVVRKYGIYTMINGTVIGNGNSIFSVISDASGEVISGIAGQPGDRQYYINNDTLRDGAGNPIPFHYRYQDSCLIHLPDTVYYMGHIYTHLRDLPVDTFIMIFNDSIASSLLPLHPEYCSLLNCGEDAFAKKMQSIPDVKTAEAMGLFRLTDIILKDPLYAAMQAHTSIYHSHAMDTLSLTINGLQSLDTIAIGQAYCQCGNENALEVCLNHIFQEPIAGGVLGNDYVKEQYFSNIVSLYLSNRSRYLFNLSGNGTTGCATCSNVRMTLVPPPVFMPMFGTGVLASGPGSFFGTAMNINPAGATSFQSALLYIANFDTSQRKSYADSIQLLYNAQNDTLALGAINMIKQQIVNCSLDTNKINAVGDTLFAMVQAGLVNYGNFSPDQIRYALVVNNIALTDLCNPYIVNYDNVSPTSSSGSTPFKCLESSFYTSASSFLNDAPLSALENIGTVYTTSLASANAFENAIIDHIGTNTAKVKAEYNTTDKLYTLYFYKTNMSDTSAVRVYFQDGDSTGSCAQTFHLNTGETIQLTISCTNDIPSEYLNWITNGYINKYTFAATVMHTQGGVVNSCLLPGWTDKIAMSAIDQNNIADAVPPTEMRELMSEFSDTLAVYSIKGADHPYFSTMLRNFTNWKLHKSYSADQYERYIESCALADDGNIALYYTYAELTFDNVTNAQTFINAVSAIDTTIVFYPAYFDRTSKSVAYDFNQLPKDKLKQYYKFIKNYSGTGVDKKAINNPFIDFSTTEMGRLLIPSSDSFVPNPDSIFVGSQHRFTLNLGGTHTASFGTEPPVSYKIYLVRAPSGSTFASNSNNMYLLEKYLWDHSVNGHLVALRESTIGPEYNLPEKKAYLEYAYQNQNLSPSRVLDSLKTDYIQFLPEFAGKNIQYGHPMAPGDLQNLYVLDPATATTGTGYGILNYIINQASSASQGHLFFNGANVRQLPSNNLLTAYRCSGHVYWYRYFDPSDNLFNVFIPVPSYLDSMELASCKFVAIEPAPGDSSSRAFHILLHCDSLPTLDLDLIGYTDFTVAHNEVLHDVLLYPSLFDHPATADTTDNCEREVLKSAIYEGQIAYQNYIDSVRTTVYNGFMSWMLGGNIHEELWMNYASQRFNTTLYYYDRAGNLMRTVPPAGVDTLTVNLLPQVDQARTANTSPNNLFPTHKKSSFYKYNSLNQVVDQSTPDGGETKYYCDAAGRVVFSQNDKQRPSGNMTYTLYDAQGRIMETGQAKIACPWFQQTYSSEYTDAHPLYPCAYKDPSTNLYTPYPPIVYNLKHETQQDVVNYVRNLDRSEVVATLYDDVAMNLSAISGMSAQDNLRQRVSAIKYFDYLPSGSHPDDYTYAMYFSYDIAGNVKTLTRDYPGWKESGQEFKRVDYDYDLISGKVNLLSYNRGFADQYFQRYDYDADNRITEVESSADGVIWQRDAGYEYYQHGPLARMSVGDRFVQGVDYAYTIQGWLKAVNSNLLNPAKDMGKDGSPSSQTVEANDAMAFSIDYFKGDYRPIGSDSVSFLPPEGKSLYNGNISRTTMALLPFDNLNTRYTYDQLNRIMQADYANVSQTGTLSNTAKYYSSYGYDPDGNLQKLVRNGNKAILPMDSMVYQYTAPPMYNNRLLNVNDYAADNYDNDIKHNTNAAVSRYMYDATGNVIKDLVSGQDTIEWNHYNKVTQTQKDTLGNGLMFAYDGAGNRYMKAVTSVSGDTAKYNQEYEVRDAQGNVLAVYNGESVYKTEAKTVWVKYILDDILTAVSTHEMLANMADPVYAQEGHFKNNFLSQSVKSTTWANGQISAQPVSWYLIRNNAVRINMLGHTGNYGNFYTSMAAYNDGAGGSLTADALDSLFMKDPAGANNFQVFADKMLNRSYISAAIQAQTLTKLCAQGALLSRIMDGIGLSYEPKSCTENVSMLQSYIATNGTEDLAGVWYGAGRQLPSDFFNFLQSFTTDDSLMGNTAYTGAEGSLLSSFQQALIAYCPANRLGGFMDQWESAGAMMQSTNSAQSLLSVVYDDAPAVVMESYVTNQGKNDAIVNALAAIPALTPSSLIYAGEAHLSWYHSQTLYQQILKYQRIWLASHVLYGSSRLGTKDYLPGQIYSLVDYQQAQPVIDTAVLNSRRSWYSGKYNDNIQANATTAWGHTQTDPFGSSERIGEKQYELTNHLGNVQATVSDNPYLVAEETTDTILATHPALRSAYDYYPFGMLMPGRYVSDTSQHCVTVTQPTWGWKEVTVACWDVYSWQWPGYTRTGGGTAVVDGDAVKINAPNATDAVSFDFPVTPNVQQELNLDIKQVSLNDKASVQIMELQGENWVTLAQSPINVVSGGMTIPFRPTGSSIRVVWNGKILVWVRRDCISKLEWVEEDQLVTVCDGDKDKYRFGFNGKEKVNEWAGIGNYVDFGARGLDSRTGRWQTPDPKEGKYPNLSPYNFAANSPIILIDRGGKDIWIADFNRRTHSYNLKLQYKNGKLYDEKGKEITTNNKFINQVKDNLDALRSESKSVGKMVSDMAQSKTKTHYIQNFNPGGDPDASGNGGEIGGNSTYTYYNPHQTDLNEDGKTTSTAVLAHELKHGYDRANGTLRTGWAKKPQRNSDGTLKDYGFRKSEWDAINVENQILYDESKKLRMSYGGIPIPKNEYKAPSKNDKPEAASKTNDNQTSTENNKYGNVILNVGDNH